jgi:hypothetical protein
MFQTNLAKRAIKQIGTWTCAVAMSFGVCLAPTSAFASPPTKVYIAGHKLVVTVDGVDYAAYTAWPTASCGFTVSQDTFKEWQSLIQAALLAGKNISFESGAPCGGERLILNVSVLK